MPGPKLHLLCERSRVWELVTFDTSGIVVSRSKPVFNSLALRKNEQIVFKSTSATFCGWFRLVVGVAIIWGSSPDAKTIEKIVRFGIHIRGQRFTSTLAFNWCRHPHWQGDGCGKEY